MENKLNKTMALLLGTVILFTIQPKTFAFSTELHNKIDNSIILYVGESKAFVNGKEEQIDTTNASVSPVIIDNNTLVPVRFISESLGANVTVKDNNINLSLTDKNVDLEIGTPKIVVNGSESAMTVESQIINDRTFIPLRALVEALGKKVFWDDRGLIIISNKEITIDNNQIDSVISRFIHKGSSYGSNVNYGQVVQNGEWIYYCDKNERFVKVKLDGSQKTQISFDIASCINILDDWIYCQLSSYDGKRYVNLGLFKIKIDGSEKIKLSDDEAGSLNIIKDTIYYTNASDYYKPYKINLDGSNRQRINDYPMKCLNVLGDKAYFQNDIDEKLYSMNIDGTNVKKIADDSSYYLHLNPSDGWLYYYAESKPHGLYKVKLDGSDRQLLDENQISYINVVDDWIYYGIFDKGIYRMRVDGTNKQKLCDGKQSGIYIIDDWIYYNKYEANFESNNYVIKDLGIYKMRLDGSENQLFSKIVESNKNNDDTNISVKPVDIVVADPNESGNSSGNLANKGYVAQKGEWIYYRNSSEDDKLYKVKTDGTNKTKLSEDKPCFINVVSGWIYYVNESDGNKPYRIKEDGTQKIKLDDNGSANLFVLGSDIYFSSKSSINLDIYKMKNNGTSKMKITKDTRVIAYINVINDWIYFSDTADGRISKIKTDGSKETQLNNCLTGKYIILDNSIYYSNMYDGNLYKMNLKGMENEKIGLSDNTYDFNIMDGWIYYSEKSDGDKLYKKKLDGSAKVKISDIPASSINITDNWIYFRDKSDKVFNYYRVKKDGSGQEVVD